MKRNIRVFLALVFTSVILTLHTGCTSEEVITTSEKVSTTAVKLLAVAPPQAVPFLVLISAIAGAVGATTAAVSQFRKARKMKSAIVEKANQIDKVIIASEGNPTPGKKPVLDFLRADMRLADGKRLEALNDFDKVRKGLM